MISENFASRIKQSYMEALNDFETYGDSMWRELDERKLPVHQVLTTQNPKFIADYLSNPASHELFFGFDETYSSSDYVINEMGPEDLIISALNFLAQAVGAVPVVNPESVIREEKISPNGLIAKIVQYLKVDISFPYSFPKEFGLQTKYGVITYRIVQSLYQSHLVVENIQRFNLKGNTVLEIGGGLGRNAYYLSNAKIQTTLVDLPLTQVASATYLGKVLGEANISLNGENFKNSVVRFLTPKKLYQNSHKTFTISMNCDSFVEMDVGIANRYAEFCLNNSNLLISMNHEANSFKVLNLESLKGHNLSRDQYWLRPGYTKDVYSAKVRL
jgi:hypothetical protein